MVRFTEKQYSRQPLFLVVIGAITLGAWAVFVQQIVRGKPVGENPMSDWGVVVVAILFGLGLPALLLMMHVRTTVGEDRVVIEVRPFTRREILADDIVRFGQRPVNPVREYGGWGIRGYRKSNRAYLMSGNTGVQLELANGDRVLIGSNRPDELETAIAVMKDAVLTVRNP